MPCLEQSPASPYSTRSCESTTAAETAATSPAICSAILSTPANYSKDALSNSRIPGSSGGTNSAIGYDAELLIEICDLYLRARNQKLLRPNERHLAQMAEIIVRACAKVGIIALVDEATGYQEVRERRALQLKLQAFIADDMQESNKNTTGRILV